MKQQIADQIKVRIVDLPLSDRLRDLRQKNLNNLIRVSGVVTRRTGVFPLVKEGYYDCAACNQVLGPFSGVFGEPLQKPAICSYCDAKAGFSLNSADTVYGNYQKLTLQESPGSVPPGRVPRYKDVILLDDLIDVARPGEDVDVCGIYEHSKNGSLTKDKSGFPVFSTIISANYVQKKSGSLDLGLSDSDVQMIRDLSMDPHVCAFFL